VLKAEKLKAKRLKARKLKAKKSPAKSGVDRGRRQDSAPELRRSID